MGSLRQNRRKKSAKSAEGSRQSQEEFWQGVSGRNSVRVKLGKFAGIAAIRENTWGRKSGFRDSGKVGCLGGEDGESDVRAEGIRNGFGGELGKLEAVRNRGGAMTASGRRGQTVGSGGPEMQ